MKEMMRPHRARMRGFTLVELMVTLGVVAILGIIAVPNFHTFMLNQRRDSVVDALVASLQYSRNQALNMDQPTTLCAGVSGVPCPGGVWTGGWEVVQQPASSSTAILLTTHALQATSTAPTVTATFGSTGLVFGGNGLVTFVPALASGDEILRVCDTRGVAYARAVEINSAGYIQSSPTPGVTPAGAAIAACP